MCLDKGVWECLDLSREDQCHDTTMGDQEGWIPGLTLNTSRHFRFITGDHGSVMFYDVTSCGMLYAHRP